MNPLLNIGLTPAFDKISAADVEPAIEQLLAQSRAAIDAIAQVEPKTYETAVLALDQATEPLDHAMSVVRHLEAVSTTPELRAAFNKVEPITSEFYSSIPLNEALWSSVKQITEAAPGVDQRYLERTIRGFKRSGADLPPEGKAHLKEIDVELTKLTTKFSENVLDSTNEWELIVTNESKLAGLPESALAAAKQSAQAKGKDGWRFTLQAPSYMAVMTYLDDRSTREQMWLAYNSRAASGEKDNRQIMARIVELRQEKAKLLGYANFADLVLEERMAKTGQRAMAFVEELFDKTKARFEKEKVELEQFAGFKLEPWDVGYWSEKQRKALYDFDEEELRPYFPVDRVVNGMFNIYQELFDIRITERSGTPGWDAAVKCFEVRASDGRLAGIFYSDWFPRENKRGGAWMDCLITGGPVSNGFDPHVGLICGNLTPPIGDKPALLTHREVETIFHEFGHLLHQLLSTVKIRSLAGTHVPWDFVELPSQIMENWCWEREALDRFACHYQTGEPIPQVLFDRMKRARNFRAATFQMRQLSFGITDLKLHIEYDPGRDGDIVTYARNLMQPMSPAPLPDTYAMIAGFTHLFADPVGYGAGYYSYKWAEVLDADAFTRFQREGIFNPKTGIEYRDRILAKGNSEDPADLYRSFMGRDPDMNALLARSGLEEAAPVK